MKKIVKLIALSCLLAGCDDLFVPAIQNNLGFEHMYENPNYAEGILANGYTRIPCGSYSFNDVATDDAVSNLANNSYRRMATGSWSAESNPTETWVNCRSAIQYLNLFIANCDKVHWADDELVSVMYNERMKGEAYGLRAMYMFYLLQSHAGWSADGELLGIPIITEPEDANSNFNQPRATFEDCLKALYADIELALEMVPTEYADITSDSQIPAKYVALGVTRAQYNRVFGDKFLGRMSGRIAEAFRAKAALLAASPAYSDGNTTTYAQAAEYTGLVLSRIGGVAQGIDPTGWTWYTNTADIGNLGNGKSPLEVMWRGGVSTNKDLEADHFPPSLYGTGRLNPTQNLVDAFPMANGYPISSAQAGYNSSTPYENRDPRLTKYIVVNESSLSGTTITTAADGTNNDALNKEDERSTRTGYYMRKLLREDVNLNPNSINEQRHYTPRIRFTELFLNYAEAANEAYGPTGTGTYSFSAYDVVKAIRKRAGVGAANGDAYLESIKNDKERMRALIRNERRLELCFEGFRFWDLRRWKESITEPACGVSIAGSSSKTYQFIEVESRTYEEFMYHGPIPYSEVLKFNMLQQNRGWR